MRHFTLYFQSGTVVETLEKKVAEWNAAEYHANSFSKLWVRAAAAAIGIRWHCNALQIVNMRNGT